MRAAFILLLALAALSACKSERAKGEEHGHDDKHGEDKHGGDKHGEDKHGEEGEEHHEGEVHLTPDAITRSEIRTERAALAALAGGLEIPAEISIHSDRVAHVTTLVPGRVRSAEGIVGARVKKGSTLAVLESAELSNANAQLRQAEANVEVAQTSHARQQELQDAGIGAKRDALEAEAELRRTHAELVASQQRVELYGGGGGTSTTLRSPLDGEILQRHATVGETIKPEETLFVVGDLSKVWVLGRVYEQDVAIARVGAPAELMLQAYPGKVFSGKLNYVAPQLEERTRTLLVRMELDNREGILRPGLFGTLRLLRDDAGAPKRLVVPESAVQRTNEGDIVFVPADEPGAFKPAPVALGARHDGRVEILSGIAEGQPVVVSGAFVLRSELLKGQLGEHHH